MQKEKQNENLKQNGNVSNETNNEAINNDSGYYVNIDGEDVEVDVKSDEEYSCLLNSLEGYYIYGIGREDECDEKCE